MVKISLIVLVLLALAIPAAAMSVEDDCTMAYEYPQCGWCWTQCLFALMEDQWFSSTRGWDWSFR